MTANLIEPTGDDEILDADPDALKFNAIMTGDVFASVAMAGEAEPATVMVAGHPCTIRGAHGALRPRVACVRVVTYHRVPYRVWPTGHRNVFPIAGSAGLGEVAADLQEWVTVDSSELTRTNRRLTLTERGFVVLHQRIVASLTRVVVDPILVEAAAHHVLREAELERDWVQELDATAAVEDLVAGFAAFMDDADRRERLKRPELESAVRKELRAHLRELTS